MKKLLAILLTLAMFATMIPVLTVGVSAEAPTYSESWDKHYDLSWITPVGSSNSNTVTVGSKHYQVIGYAESANTTFEIDTPAELAGLAYLVNAKNTGNSNNNDGNGCAFLNCTIKIVKDIDLSGYYWMPIGKTFDYKFAGKLIGDKDEQAITISNMVIYSTEQPANNPLRGLVGAKAGGSIENINLTNAYITTAGFRVGSFAGQFNNATIKNCSSDATIVTTGERSDNVWDACGGIVGCTYSGTNGVTIQNCTFTGTIDSKGEIAGGLVGTTEGNTTVSGCTVNSDKIATAATSGNQGNNPSRVGVGGIAGVMRGGITASSTTVKATIVCNNSATTNYAGGLLGCLHSNATLTDCSFEGTVQTNNSRGFLGQGANGGTANSNAGMGWNLTLINCENKGTVTVTNANTLTQLRFQKGIYDDSVVTSLGVQKSTISNAVRVVAQVKADALTGAGFDFIVSYKNAQDETVTTSINQIDVTKAFTSIIVAENEQAAKEGYVWVAFVLKDIDSASITISAVASAKYESTTVYGTVGTSNAISFS